MNGLPGVQVLERVVRRTALGLRFVDTATGDSAIDGLLVDVCSATHPTRRTPARPNRSGVYVASGLPGLGDFERDLPPDDTAWSAPPRALQVRVSDPQGRFLPVRFDAAAPTRGLFNLLAPWLSPPLAMAFPWAQDTGSPPMNLLPAVPLFSSPQRALPDPLAVVRAQLCAWGSAQPAAGALLGVSIGGRARGLGLADGQGRVAVMFPYPEPARRRLSSPPEPRDDFSWALTLTVFSAPPLSPPSLPPSSPPARTDDAPDLLALLGQLQHPRSVRLALLSPPDDFRLDYRVPLTVRSAAGVGPGDVPVPADASFLFFT